VVIIYTLFASIFGCFYASIQNDRNQSFRLDCEWIERGAVGDQQSAAKANFTAVSVPVRFVLWS
jgi:hypothetical protein